MLCEGGKQCLILVVINAGRLLTITMPAVMMNMVRFVPTVVGMNFVRRGRKVAQIILVCPFCRKDNTLHINPENAKITCDDCNLELGISDMHYEEN